MSTKKLSIIAVIFLVVGFWLGTFLHSHSDSKKVAEQSAEYPLINRAITANIGKHFIINFKPLRVELQELQKKYPPQSYVYFSYLNNGSWIGLNERDEFTAASTLKVPIAMAMLKAVEEKKVALTDSYNLEEFNLDKGFGDLYQVGANNDFTVARLLEIMLEESDNTALSAIIEIFRRIGIEDPLEGVYGALGWEFTQNIPELGQGIDYSKINLKTLSNLFLALYDAKYLTLEHSQLILDHLANSPFNDRIVAGVPSGVVVSHKIGTASGDDTFSDCGIVYAPNRSYLLCVGMHGAPEATAAKFMAEISKEVYDYVIRN